MRTTLIVIALIVAATIILVIFYQPANQVIRRTFEQLTGMQLVSSTTWKEMKLENSILNQEMEAQKEKTARYQDKNIILLDSLKEKQQHIASLESDLADMKEDFALQEDVFDDMDEIQHLQLFDTLTEADHVTEISDDNRALVTHERIKDANWKLHERSYYKQRSETLSELSATQQDYIERMHQVKANLQLEISSRLEEKAILRKKYENCLGAHEDIESEANRKAMAGYAVGLAGLLIGLFL